MIGQTISHYKITAKLGEGGMGVVYKAEDTELKRPVALKFIAANLIKDVEASKRFRREATAAAGVNHANVCHVYEISGTEDHTFLAMEFVEGESLDKRIEQGPLPLKDALDIARQVAEGLAAAHAKGVVHRDVKPGNLLVTPGGQVKILDFGLALLTEGSKLTQLDTKVGTVAYMSPEQAQGMEVDHRSDIWSLGCVLYEMVCGQRPFRGAYDQALLYEIINQEPEPLTGVRAGVPMELEFIVGKCLAKDPEDRPATAQEVARELRTLGDKLKSGRSTILRGQVLSQTMATPPGVTTQSPVGPLVRYRVIENVEDSAESAKYLAEDTQLQRSVSIRVLPQSSAEKIERAQRRTRTLLLTTAAAAVFLASVVAFLLRFSPPPVPETPLRRFALPIDGPPLQRVAISPDGRHIAYTVGNSPGEAQLWIWDFDRGEPRRIDGTSGVDEPFWSPNSEFLAFRALPDRELTKVSVHGGPTTVICSMGQGFLGGSWSPDGSSIVFSSRPEPGERLLLYEVSAQGGTAKPLLEVPEAEQQQQVDPNFLPTSDGGRALLFARGTSLNDSEIVVLDGTTGHQNVLTRGRGPVYSPTGHIVYQIEDALWALPFSIETLQATGEPFTVAGRGSYPSVARDGTLVYRRRDEAGLQQLVWRDRKGQKLGNIGAPQPSILFPVLSPDGSQVVVRGGENGNFDIWVHEVARPVKRRLTFDPAAEDRPTWTPQGGKIAFTSARTGNPDVFIKPADGSGEEVPLFESAEPEFGFDWSKDGKYLVGSGGSGEAGRGLWYLHAAENGSYEKVMFFEAAFDTLSPDLSPDAKLVAYESNDSGRYEIYVQPFPGGGGKWQVSTNGGRQPRWSADGKEIFYVQDKTLMAVPVSAGAAFSAGNPEPLFEDKTAFQGRGQTYDVTPDGKRFITVETLGGSGSGQAIQVVQNWFEEFRGREKN